MFTINILDNYDDSFGGKHLFARHRIKPLLVKQRF